MSADAELLLCYSRDGSEEAFTALVERHLGLVYSAASRRLNGDTHAAKDATQAVFTALACNAAQLSRRPVLAGWLHTATHYATARIIRTERRRQRREKEAYTMSELALEQDPSLDWQKIRPLLDDVMNALPERDREAILLRFFEDRTFTEVGRKLGISEDGARLRVSRALDKMNTMLSRKHLASTASALGVLLAQEALATAPIGLTASIVHSALAGAAAGASIGFLPFIAMNKLSIGIATAAITAGTVGLIVQQHSQAQQDAEIARLRQEVQSASQALDQAQAIAKQERTTRIAKEGEIAALKKVTREKPQIQLELPVQPAGRTGFTLATGLTRVEPSANKGRGTPRDLVETIHSAIAGGDVSTVQAATLFDDATRGKIEALFAALSPEAKATYGTPEEMIATMESTSTPAVGLQILGTRQADADHATLRVQVQYGDGRVRENEWSLQRTDDGWRWVFPSGLVQKYAVERAGVALPGTPDALKPSTGGTTDRGAALVHK